jgi:hypothetical protein
MATMTTTDLAALHTDLMRDLSRALEPCGVLKADLRAAVDALDQYLSDNGAAINTAIPQPARSALTTPQKARLLMLVIQRRYLTGV